MKYILELQRIAEFKDIIKPPKGDKKYKKEDSTLGIVNLYDDKGDSLFTCYSCENIGESTDTPMQDKRIIARDYQLEWTNTSKNSSPMLGDYKHKALWLKTKELESFAKRRILIHTGNYPQDTEGCLLFGYTENKNGTISRSTDCIIDFFNLVKKLGVENITLRVKEIETSEG